VPLVMAPLDPCHEIVQPPHWLPRSSAFFPATWILRVIFESGSTRSSFLRRTSDFRTASRPTCRWASEPTWERSERSVQGFSQSPSAIFWRRMRRTASSIRDCGTRPDWTSDRSVETNSG
jgi:hypothetical protein